MLLSISVQPDGVIDFQVGHNALGAGQIIDQGARLVDEAISSGRMYGYDCGWKYIQPVRVHFCPIPCNVS